MENEPPPPANDKSFRPDPLSDNKAAASQWFVPDCRLHFSRLFLFDCHQHITHPPLAHPPLAHPSPTHPSPIRPKEKRLITAAHLVGSIFPLSRRLIASFPFNSGFRTPSLPCLCAAAINSNLDGSKRHSLPSSSSSFPILSIHIVQNNIIPFHVSPFVHPLLLLPLLGHDGRKKKKTNLRLFANFIWHHRRWSYQALVSMRRSRSIDGADVRPSTRDRERPRAMKPSRNPYRPGGQAWKSRGINRGLIIGFSRVATTMHPLINQRGTRWDNNEHGGPGSLANKNWSYTTYSGSSSNTTTRGVYRPPEFRPPHFHPHLLLPLQ